jgi:hypothetical protein
MFYLESISQSFMPIFQQLMINALADCDEFEKLLDGDSPTGASSG